MVVGCAVRCAGEVAGGKTGGHVGNGEAEVKRVDTTVLVPVVVPISEIGVALLVEGVSEINILFGRCSCS